MEINVNHSDIYKLAGGKEGKTSGLRSPQILILVCGPTTNVSQHHRGQDREMTASNNLSPSWPEQLRVSCGMTMRMAHPETSESLHEANR